MTVLEIIREYLTANGYDGLWRDDEDGCACTLDDLAPCLATCGGNDITDCKAGHVKPDSDPPLVGPKEAVTQEWQCPHCGWWWEGAELRCPFCLKDLSIKEADDE